MDEILNDSNEINLQYISDQVNILKEKVKSIKHVDPNDTEVFLVGCTGSGKTTLSHLLGGELMECIQNNGAGFVVQPVTKTIQGLGDVGHECISKTYVPGSVKKNDIVINDIAGIGDNRGINLRIINALVTHELIPKGNCKLRVLIVMSAPEIIADRGKTANTIFEAVENFINRDQWESTLGIVITKIDKIRNEKARGLIQLLKGGKYKGKILDFFLTNPSNIFEIPKPNSEGPYNPQTEINKLNQFLQNAQPIQSENRGLLLDSETLKDLFNIYTQISQNYKDKIINLVNEINRKVTINKECTCSINNTKQVAINFKNAIQKGMNDFRIALKNNQCFSSKVGDALQVVDVFIPLNDFFQDLQKYSIFFESVNMKSPIINYSNWTYEIIDHELVNIDNFLNNANEIKKLKEQGEKGRLCQQQLQDALNQERIKLSNLQMKSEEDIREMNKKMEERQRQSQDTISNLNSTITELKNRPPEIRTKIEKQTIYQTIEKVVYIEKKRCNIC